VKKFLFTVVPCALAFALPAGAQADTPAFGCPAPLASLSFPEPRVCAETQGWWLDSTTTGGVPEAPPVDAAFRSTHVHLMVPFPMGERLLLPASGGYSWPYYSQIHNGVGGTSEQVRGGAFQFGSCCPKDPALSNRAITSEDQQLTGSIPIPASTVDAWRAFTGKRENRFTADTTSPFGKRQYQSGAWHAYLNSTGAPVGYTARGWYASTGYTNFSFKDSNIGTGKGLQASQLRDTCAPASVTMTYSLAQGATLAFLYLDPSLHGGSKGTVVAENKGGSKGSFTFSTVGLASGVHVVLGGAWEKGPDGWGAAVARLPIRVC
jgi:hypothetical protein